MNLYPHQEKARLETYAHIRAGKSDITLASSTGSGKTAIARQFTADAMSRDGVRVLFNCHRDILIHQTARTFRDIGEPIGLVFGDKKLENRDARIQIATFQSLASRWDAWLADWIGDGENLVMLDDESHITSWTDVIKRARAQATKAKRIKLTATPWRLKKTEGFLDISDALVQTANVIALQAQHRLCKMRYFGVHQDGRPDLSGVKKLSGGDYKLDDLARATNRPEYVKALVNQWKSIAPGRRTIAFSVDVQHAEDIAEAFNAAGIPAACVSGSTSDRDCDRIYKDLAARRILVLASCQKLCEGFDVPAVSCVILARKTASRCIHIQQIGRGARTWNGETWEEGPGGILFKPCPDEPRKQDCIVIDQAGNLANLGYLESILSYELQKGQPADIVVASKGRKPRFCPICEVECDPGAVVCPNPSCKHEFPKPAVKKVAPPPGLVEVKPEMQIAMARQDFDGPQKWYNTAMWKAMCAARLTPPTRPWNEFHRRFAKRSDSWYRHLIFGENFTEENVMTFTKYLDKCLSKRLISPETKWAFLEREFGPAKAQLSLFVKAS